MTKDEMIMWQRSPATVEVMAAVKRRFPLNYRQCQTWDDKKYIDGARDVQHFLKDTNALWEDIENV